MIISHQHKFVFVHNPKTAGSSVKHWLFANGPSLNLKGAKSQYFPLYSDFPDHFKCSQLEDIDFLDDYHKASTVRNTWDRVVSMWRFQIDKGLTKLSFEEYLLQGLNAFRNANPNKKRRFPRFSMTPPQHVYTHVNGEQWVDEIMRFETLQDDWKELQKAIGIDPSPLPHANKSKTPKPSEWTQDLSDIVSEVYAKDISLFGCTPPEFK